MTKINEAARLLGKRSAKRRRERWGEEEFKKRMREWGRLGGRPPKSGEKVSKKEQ